MDSTIIIHLIELVCETPTFQFILKALLQGIAQINSVSSENASVNVNTNKMCAVGAISYIWVLFPDTLLNSFSQSHIVQLGPDAQIDRVNSPVT